MTITLGTPGTIATAEQLAQIRADLGAHGTLTDVTTAANAATAQQKADFREAVGVGEAGAVQFNSTEVTSSRALTSADFDGTVLVLNHASTPIAITVPTVASLGLATDKAHVLAFFVKGAAIPTFAGATASTAINGTAGTTTVLPLGGAPVQHGFYVLTQQGANSNNWSLM